MRFLGRKEATEHWVRLNTEFQRTNFDSALYIASRLWQNAPSVPGVYSQMELGIAAAHCTLRLARPVETSLWLTRVAWLSPTNLYDAVCCGQVAFKWLGYRQRAQRLLHARLDSRGKIWSLEQLHKLPYPQAEFCVTPKSLKGKTVLVVPLDEGLGDQIQGARFLPLLRSHCARVVVATQPSLVGLFQEACVADEVVSIDAHPRPQHTMLMPVETIPYLLGVNLDGPSLSENATYLARPRQTTNDRRRIAIVWAAADEDHTPDGQRSMSYEALRAIVEGVPDVTWVGLQVGPRFNELRGLAKSACIEDHSRPAPDGDGFLTDAKVLATVDQLITVDSAPAHLAGAMGIPVWTILSVPSACRWGLSGDTTALYPTMRLVRRGGQEKWVPFAHRLVRDLSAAMREGVGRVDRRSVGGS